MPEEIQDHPTHLHHLFWNVYDPDKFVCMHCLKEEGQESEDECPVRRRSEDFGVEPHVFSVEEYYMVLKYERGDRVC